MTDEPTTQQLDEIAARAAGLYEYATGLDAAWQDEADQLAGTDVPALLAEVLRLRAERDDLGRKLAEAAASLAEQVQRNGKRQREHNADREELERLRAAMDQIRHLHTDSPMGPCPVCIDADAAAAGGDGLVPYPCPTGRLAGAQDCEPPSFRTAAEESHVVADDTIWLERRPCGCIVSAVVAVVPGEWTLNTAEDVALHFHPTEGKRRRAAQAGLTVEPVTGAQYREQYRDRWHCDRHRAVPAARSAAV